MTVWNGWCDREGCFEHSIIVSDKQDCPVPCKCGGTLNPINPYKDAVTPPKAQQSLMFKKTIDVIKESFAEEDPPEEVESRFKYE